MNSRVPIILSLVAACAAFTSAKAVTVPAGTTIVVRTTEPMTSHETIRRMIRTAVAHDVVANGKVALRTGTPATAIVVTSLRHPGRPEELTLNLRSVSVNGHNVPVHTTGAYIPRSHAPRTAHGAAIYRQDHTYNQGTILRYQLAQPLEIHSK